MGKFKEGRNGKRVGLDMGKIKEGSKYGEN